MLMILRTLYISIYLIYTAKVHCKYHHCHLTEEKLRLMKLKKVATWTLYRYVDDINKQINT